MCLLYTDINSFENLLHKEKGRSLQYIVLSSLLLCRLQDLVPLSGPLYKDLSLCKLNPDAVAVHFNNNELVIFKTRTTFLSFLVNAAGANNDTVCHRLAL